MRRVREIWRRSKRRILPLALIVGGAVGGYFAREYWPEIKDAVNSVVEYIAGKPLLSKEEIKRMAEENKKHEIELHYALKLSPEERERIERLNEREQILLAARISSQRFNSWLNKLEDISKKEKRDLTIRFQERGLPELGEIYLKMGDLDHEGDYLEKAKKIANIILENQTECGGWNDNALLLVREDSGKKFGLLGKNFQDTKNRKVSLKGKDKITFQPGSFREGPTQHSIQFLIGLNKRIKDPRIDIRIRKGLEFIVENQKESGGWSGYPGIESAYLRCDTFNDGTINDCISALIEGYRTYDDEKYLEAIKKAGEFIIKTQNRTLIKDEKGEFAQAGWAQHYDEERKPTQGREFEPASICSRETAMNIRTLIELYKLTGNRKYLESAEKPIEWLRRSKLNFGVENEWAMFYSLEDVKYLFEDGSHKEIKPNTPIFPLSDGKSTVSIDINQGRIPNGYGWVGDFWIPYVIAEWERTNGHPETYEQLQDRLSRIIMANALQTLEHIKGGIELPGKYTNYTMPMVVSMRNLLGYLDINSYKTGY